MVQKVPTTEEGVDLWADQSHRAQGVLNYILHEEDPEILKERSELVAIEDARRAEQIIDQDTGRSKSRVLLVSQDARLLEDNSGEQNSLQELAEFFDEIHVQVLLNKKTGPNPRRIHKNIWLYPTIEVGWRALTWQAVADAREWFTFNDSIRPDIIVAKDGYESAIAASVMAGIFKRPYQVHITDQSYITKTAEFGMRNYLSRRAVRRANGIRVATDAAYERMVKWLPKHKDITQLPVFHNFSQYAESTPQFTLQERYPDYNFFILVAGALTADSNLHDTFSALNPVLQNPKIALVVIGSGKAKSLFVEKAKLLAIERNVIFLDETIDQISCYRSADVLVETGTSPESERRILRAIMATLPVIAYETETRNDLFIDGESAYLCEQGDVWCITQKLNSFLNQAAYRIQFSRQEREIAASRIHENPTTYQRALRDSIELTLLQSVAVKVPAPSEKSAVVSEPVPVAA